MLCISNVSMIIIGIYFGISFIPNIIMIISMYRHYYCNYYYHCQCLLIFVIISVIIFIDITVFPILAIVVHWYCYRDGNDIMIVIILRHYNHPCRYIQF